MRALLFACGLVALGGCGRAPFDLSDGGGEPEEDAGAEHAQEASPSSAAADAAQPPPVDAGGEMPSCADADMDGVCDDQDNCPSVVNRDQADANGNGVGDACEVGCAAEAIASSISIDRLTVTNVKLNGQANVITVAPNEVVSVEFSYDMPACPPRTTPPIPLRHQILVGRESGAPECAVDAFCMPLNGNSKNMIMAPATPGVYYVSAAISEEPTCPSAWSSAIAPSQRIAAICVQ